jgi:uncharacterized membrane protein
MFSLGILWLFRLVHILAGVFWVGGILMFGRFLFPAAQALGPAAGPVMDHLNRVRKLPQALMGAAFANVLSGLGLYWNLTMGFQPEMMGTPPVMVFGFGGIMAISAVVLGLSVNAPTAKRMGALMAAVQAQGGPPKPEQAAELQRLQGRLGWALKVVMVLLVLTTAAMALARYAR